MKMTLFLVAFAAATISIDVQAQEPRSARSSCTDNDTSQRCERERAREKARRNGEAMRAVKGLPRNYSPTREGAPEMAALETPAPLLQAMPTDPIRTSPQSGQIGQLSVGAGQAAPAGTPNAVSNAQGGDFDIELFAQNIEDTLDGSAVGYAYSVSAGKVLAKEGADGFSRTPADTLRLQSAQRRGNIGSVSKTLTAIAVLQLMDDLNISPNDPIHPYLPDLWSLGANTMQLTFRHLLNHQTGLNSANNDFWSTLDWDGLRAVIAQGANPGAPFNYLNANYALFRFMIPEMWRQTGETPNASNDTGLWAALYYIAYMQNHVFEPLGIHNAQCVDEADNRTLYYDPAGVEPGGDAGDWLLICGSGGWFLSSNELLNVIVNAAYNDDYLSPEMRALLFGGTNATYAASGEQGSYLNHSGVVGIGGGRGYKACFMKFAPIEVEAALLINSATNGIPEDPCTGVLVPAFDAAWN